MHLLGGEVKSPSELSAMRDELEGLYLLYNSPSLIHPDPLEFLGNYKDTKDREIAGIIASSLAYGRVAKILESVGSILSALGPSPYEFLMASSPEHINGLFRGFKHRFTTAEDMACLCAGMKRVIERFGSLEACFCEAISDRDEDVLPGMSFLAERLSCEFEGGCNSLIPAPARGSACKRLNLFLRWMVRRDAVDPGGWNSIAPSKLLVPLDTHMHRICRRIGLTDRNDASLATAREITRSFRQIAPDDPVRYDFSLTRLGIRRDSDPESFFLRLERKGKKEKR
ncbi:MAG: TIGR02757 family protein [Deltaproteobacteria bacterium CG23_combo_of_CG06-09_8_20_14_all_51_20]|nr:TIGR02757 family protein [bacterium]OIP43097.1 MAG: TIGR02757 family protein [Desulfobacteraceae bacterium CG2_30_51_40]PIP47204.1 MAG: TIGR02757 family protein [Deltaproteobacteria bacterium CG23_combo_of_CG06-09_8_20_14_all_51_20]PIY26041.1 MAG: TIGR02757 family protein [Deltaproteobacteria bacterium CG_4_10_14_3_um_filter_51_14]PJB36451.1 MAG: TIGR02757 family protein [Deltaproteobacteria bacterium CG_4_9_14_3_um_filter_51_14]